MFSSAEIGHKIPKEQYDKEAPEVREQLLEAQLSAVEMGKFATLIVIGGVDGAGKGETMNTLLEWMDPRHVQTFAIEAATEEEQERPMMWRYWRALPPKGKTGLFFGSWYTAPIVDRVLKKIDGEDFEKRMQDITRFERMLFDEGVLVIKFWFHLSKSAQKKRLESLQKDPKERWRVTPEDWKRFKIYDRFRGISDRALRVSSTAHAPWTVVEGGDSRFRNLTVARAVLEAIKGRIATKGEPPPDFQPAVPLPAVDRLNVLRTLDLSQKISEPKYDKLIDKYQRELALLTRKPRFRELSVVSVFEGSDAAGKGGAIRRLTRALDLRMYRVIPIAAPTDEERAQPYLWRFWRHLPRRGKIAIFDRSWYGRVLVERVEGFTSEADWMRGYGEINDFEADLAHHGIVVVKYWLQISKEEQLKRFKARQAITFKRFKITEEDWRNRKKWDDYEQAVADMVDRTGSRYAPWTLVEANDKLHARVKVLETFVERLETALK
ncbi:MAG: polyphosphate:AMP phosphotransferase [Deltaproteobacteria bacterium]|nr:polyphosphate:AMP phosphotransferase [Deltaproteobacteria bacterium]